MARGTVKLSKQEWQGVVIIAGIGSIIEWFDFYSYTQLDATLQAAFFKSDAAYWAVFGSAMAARPIGALAFGHLGDTRGRSFALMLGIAMMGLATMLIGALPTYDVGPYSAGVAAPILLGTLRVCQGMAIGGQFGAATIYVSEMAPVGIRGLYTAILQGTALLGLLLALALVMVLQAFISPYNMQVWGWRIPFLLSFGSATLSIWMKKGMPEPHAFLEAARRARAAAALEAQARRPNSSADGDASKVESSKAAGSEGGQGGPGGPSRTFERVASGRLAHLLGVDHASRAKVPLMRMLQDSWASVILQVIFTAWAMCSFYIWTSWIPSKQRSLGVMPTLISQSQILAGIGTGMLGYCCSGWALDHGVRAIRTYAVVVTLGTAAGFGACYACFASELASWFALLSSMSVAGAAVPFTGLPITRLYDPLERVSGYAFGLSIAAGVIGGFTPLICNGIHASLPASLADYAAAFWMLAVAGLSLSGGLLFRIYAPSLDTPFAGHLE